MKVRTYHLIGAALDWAVAKCVEQDEQLKAALFRFYSKGCPFEPSTAWAHGGPILNLEIDVIRKRSKAEEQTLEYPDPNFKFKAEIFGDIEGYFCAFGPTALVAAMRCYVASKLGDVVEIPDDLLA